MAYNTGFENWNGRIFIEKPKSASASTNLDVEGISPIKVTTEQRGETTVKIVSYAPHRDHTVSLSVTPNILEVGQSATLNFTGAVVAGSNPISTITVSPAVANMVVNDETVTFSVIGGDNTPGLKDVHTLTAIDSAAKVLSANAGVSVRQRYRIGTIARNTTNFLEQDSRLGNSITGAYSGFIGYNIPEGQHHIVWLVPAGEGASVPTPKGTNGLPWEITGAGQVVITNSHGLAVTYDMIRTVNYYTGINTADLTLT